MFSTIRQADAGDSTGELWCSESDFFFEDKLQNSWVFVGNSWVNYAFSWVFMGKSWDFLGKKRSGSSQCCRWVFYPDPKLRIFQ